MTTTFPIVGAHFRPPAKAILQVLPAGAPLVLVREPGNQYDSNAIQVVVPTSSIPDDQAEILDMLAKGYGFDIGTIMQESRWHVGYIPAARAVTLAPQLDEGQCWWLPATLTFNAKGDTRAEWNEEIREDGATTDDLEFHIERLAKAKGAPTIVPSATPLETVDFTETIDERNPGSANGL